MSNWTIRLLVSMFLGGAIGWHFGAWRNREQHAGKICLVTFMAWVIWLVLGPAMLP